MGGLTVKVGRERVKQLGERNEEVSVKHLGERNVKVVSPAQHGRQRARVGLLQQQKREEEEERAQQREEEEEQRTVEVN